jgi:hypothetical protein
MNISNQSQTYKDSSRDNGLSAANSALEAALSLAARDWPVFPLHHVKSGDCTCGNPGCLSRGKHPRTKNGLKDGTIDDATIHEWWRQWPKANVGVCTGAKAGLFVVGPDGPEGLAALADLERIHGALPRTPTAKTGSDGEHFYFRWPHGGTIVNRRNHLGLPIDVRGEGGYVVAPPSRNANGPYEWKVAPSECNVAEAPPWLLEWCRQGPPSPAQPFLPQPAPSTNGSSLIDRAVAYLAKVPPAIAGQHGHGQTLEAARVVVWGFNLGREVGYEILAAHYNPRCQPPWSEKELRHKCDEADTVPFGKVRGWLLEGGRPLPSSPKTQPGASGTPPKPRAPLSYQPFPVQVLPEPLQSFVAQAAEALGCDPTFVALPALAVCAALVGNTRSIRLKKDWTEPAILWTAIVGDSGTLKSPAIKQALGPVFRLQKRMRDEYESAHEQYLSDKEIYDRKKKDRVKKGEPPGDPPERPVCGRVVTSDVTIERLAGLLEDNPRGLLVWRDELSGWVGGFTRYKQKGSSDLPNWLELYRGEALIVDRKTGDRPSLFVPRAAVSVTGGIQPGVLARVLTTEFFDAGLVARLLLACPPKRTKEWSEAEVAPEVRGAYEAMLESLLALDFDRSPTGERCPFAVRLTPEAKAAWVAFYRAWADEQTKAEGEVAAVLSKLEGTCARLALLFHLIPRAADRSDCDPIEPASIEAGEALVRWFAYEARRIYATLTESTEEKETRRLVEWVRSRPGGKATAKELQHSNGRKYPMGEHAEAALEALVGAGWGRWEDRPAGPKGGRPTRIFVLQEVSDETSPDEADTASEPSDETPGASDETPQFSEKNGVSSVSSVVGHKKSALEKTPGANGKPREVSSDSQGVSSDDGEEMEWTA